MPNLVDLLRQISLFAKLTMTVAIVAFGLAVAYVFRPTEQQLVDDEVRRIIETAERDAIDLLRAERSRLDALAHALLERETLDQADAYRIAGVDQPVSDAEQEAREVAGQ